MTRGKYVFENNTFVPLKRELKARQTILTDEMPALKHPANGKHYTSKGKYDAVTKLFGLEECAGEPDKYWERDRNEAEYDADIEQDILAAEMAVDYGESLNEEQRAVARLIHEREEWEANS